jgi:hypothetical protein
MSAGFDDHLSQTEAMDVCNNHSLKGDEEYHIYNLLTKGHITPCEVESVLRVDRMKKDLGD